jgi:hypothetical protein
MIWNSNFIPEEVKKSRLNLGNAGCYAVQNILLLVSYMEI